jgi:hypothetical protein
MVGTQSCAGSHGQVVSPQTDESLAGTASDLSEGEITQLKTKAAEKYPSNQFLWYVARSAAGPTQAEYEAKRGIAEQVQASLTSEVRTMKEEIRNDGITTERESFLARVASTSSFDQAALIHVDAGLSIFKNGSHYAGAYLSKQDLSEILTGQYRKSGIIFRESARSALADQDPMGFLQKSRSAGNEYAIMAASLLQLKAVRIFNPLLDESMAYAEVTRLDDVLWDSLVAAKTRKFSEMRFALEVEVVDPVRRVRTTENLLSALNVLGFTARPEAAEQCMDGYAFRFLAEDACHLGSFGSHCEIRLKGRLEECQKKTVIVEFDLSDATFRSASPKDEETARNKAWATLSGAALAGKLKVSLANILPNSP